jgi:hypothetical protein
LAPRSPLLSIPQDKLQCRPGTLEAKAASRPNRHNYQHFAIFASNAQLSGDKRPAAVHSIASGL